MEPAAGADTEGSSCSCRASAAIQQEAALPPLLLPEGLVVSRLPGGEALVQRTLEELGPHFGGCGHRPRRGSSAASSSSALLELGTSFLAAEGRAGAAEARSLADFPAVRHLLLAATSSAGGIASDRAFRSLADFPAVRHLLLAA